MHFVDMHNQNTAWGDILFFAKYCSQVVDNAALSVTNAVLSLLQLEAVHKMSDIEIFTVFLDFCIIEGVGEINVLALSVLT